MIYLLKIYQKLKYKVQTKPNLQLLRFGLNNQLQVLKQNKAKINIL